MSWTAKLTQFEKIDGTYRISIEYTDSVSGETFYRQYRQPSVTKKGLRNLARREAETLAANETNDVDIPIGTTIDVTPDPVVPPTPPTQAEIDKTAWFDDWEQLQRIMAVFEAVPALATPARQTLADGLRTSLQAGWKNSYLGDVST